MPTKQELEIYEKVKAYKQAEEDKLREQEELEEQQRINDAKKWIDKHPYNYTKTVDFWVEAEITPCCCFSDVTHGVSVKSTNLDLNDYLSDYFQDFCSDNPIFPDFEFENLAQLNKLVEKYNTGPKKIRVECKLTLSTKDGDVVTPSKIVVDSPKGYKKALKQLVVEVCENICDTGIDCLFPDRQSHDDYIQDVADEFDVSYYELKSYS